MSAEPMVMGESRADRSKGMSTAPTVTAVLAWLTIGMFTKNPTTTVPGISRKRTRRKGSTSSFTRC
jgi:hypothetical protein